MTQDMMTLRALLEKSSAATATATGPGRRGPARSS